MSRKERDRLKVMGPLAEDRLKQVEAARLLRLSVRPWLGAVATAGSSSARSVSGRAARRAG